jgi:hypothetical protein
MSFREIPIFVMNFLFWKVGGGPGGGGVKQNPLKKFAYPVQFLPGLTPLVWLSIGHSILDSMSSLTIVIPIGSQENVGYLCGS